MTLLLVSDGFKQDLASVETDALLDAILDTVDLLETIPTLGSTNVPASIKTKYGKGVRKLVVCPFDVVYEYDEEEDRVMVAGLIHQRMAR